MLGWRPPIARPLPRHGTDHDSKPLPSFPRFCVPARPFSADKKSIEVAVRPRKGSAAVCSRCHLLAPGYDQLAERRFEFIPLWGFLVFLCIPCGASTVAAAALWLSKKFLGATATAH